MERRFCGQWGIRNGRCSFLARRGLTNVALDLLLVIVIPLGVAGVAIGTVASQHDFSVLVIRCLCKTDSSYQLHFSKLAIRKVYLIRIFQVGIPAGIREHGDQFFQRAAAGLR